MVQLELDVKNRGTVERRKQRSYLISVKYCVIKALQRNRTERMNICMGFIKLTYRI